MDLALHLGFTVEGLKRAMTERELVAWATYAGQRMLPWRRIELYLAQVSMYIAATMGGAKNPSIDQFMFDARQQAPAAGEQLTAEDVAAYFGAEIRLRRGKG